MENQNKSKSNTFQEMEEQQSNNKYQNNPNGHDPSVGREIDNIINAPGEMNLDAFSDKAVGDKVKYVRPDLDGTEQVIDKFQVFTADTSKAPNKSQNGNTEYWPITMVLTYESENADGVKNKEYISGAKSFVNKDGQPSDINFWYEGSETQSAFLWELVAKKLGVAAVDMSPRQFVAFLNGKPKVIVASQKTKNYNAPEGSPKFISKNMPGEFL